MKVSKYTIYGKVNCVFDLLKTVQRECESIKITGLIRWRKNQGKIVLPTNAVTKKDNNNHRA